MITNILIAENGSTLISTNNEDIESNKIRAIIIQMIKYLWLQVLIMIINYNDGQESILISNISAFGT